tara:strand:+ start:3407 stop:3703 length:297 start_codon:yes stop_codon:yes gene_type:complete
LDEHLGLLYFLAKRYRVNGRFARWDEDELVGEFYVIARKAYDRRFDSNKGSLSRFLTLVLTQDVFYKYRRMHGAVRRRIDGKNKWIQLERGFTDDHDI